MRGGCPRRFGRNARGIMRRRPKGGFCYGSICGQTGRASQAPAPSASGEGYFSSTMRLRVLQVASLAEASPTPRCGLGLCSWPARPKPAPPRWCRWPSWPLGKAAPLSASACGSGFDALGVLPQWSLCLRACVLLLHVVDMGPPHIAAAPCNKSQPPERRAHTYTWPI